MKCTAPALTLNQRNQSENSFAIAFTAQVTNKFDYQYMYWKYWSLKFALMHDDMVN